MGVMSLSILIKIYEVLLKTFMSETVRRRVRRKDRANEQKATSKEKGSMTKQN